MDNIPFDKQGLQRSALQCLQSERAAGHELGGNNLLYAIDECGGKLPQHLMLSRTGRRRLAVRNRHKGDVA
jgi:hypothetical protein